MINARHASAGASVAARKRVYGDPRTLYGKGGGVFGLAKLSHLLMEAWMADPTLNGNAMVARWHESQQKAGFKFLVTQIMGYMTGGPQRYTGRPMDEAHMHLGITPAEWRSFIAIAARDLRGDQGARRRAPRAARDPRGLRAAVRPAAGQARRRPTRACRAPHPSSLGTAYHRLGGVYPIAHFADRARRRAQAPNSAGRHAIGVRFDAIDAPDAPPPPARPQVPADRAALLGGGRPRGRDGARIRRGEARRARRAVGGLLRARRRGGEPSSRRRTTAR